MNRQEIEDKIEQGSRCVINLSDLSMKLDGKYIINHGASDVWETDNDTILDKDAIIYKLEELYRKYKYSVPSERTKNIYRNYFKALPEKDLNDEDMLYGTRREIAKFELEYEILLLAINKVFENHWSDWFGNGWFWQSEWDKDFVILRSWVIK